MDIEKEVSAFEEKVKEILNPYMITFKKPYTFEGTSHNQVDLSNLENLTTKDLVDSDKIFASTGNMSAMNEMSVGYSCIIASKASGKPIEFFENLPANEGIKVKNMVAGFFYS